MANQPESATYDAGVYQIETSDPVQGGVGGLDNRPLLNLANRTAYLKAHVDVLESALPHLAGTKVTGVTSSVGLTLDNAGVILVDASSGNISITLPAANSNGTANAVRFQILRVDTSGNSVTLLTASGNTFALPASSTSRVLGVGESLSLASDSGTKWYVLFDVPGVGFVPQGTGNSGSASQVFSLSASQSNTISLNFTPTIAGHLLINTGIIVGSYGGQPLGSGSESGCTLQILMNGSVLVSSSSLTAKNHSWAVPVSSSLVGTTISIQSRYAQSNGGSSPALQQELSFLFVPA